MKIRLRTLNPFDQLSPALWEVTKLPAHPTMSVVILYKDFYLDPRSLMRNIMAKSSMRRVLSNRNILVLSLTNAAATFFQQVYQPYWAAYLKDVVGLDVLQIGLLRSLARSNNLLFAFPGGLLADRIGRKKVTLMGAAARIFTPLIYLFAGTWELLLIGTIVNAMQSISTAAYSAVVAESVPRDQRGTGYGVFESLRRMPMVFTGITGGILMDILGYAGGMKVSFAAGIIGGMTIFTVRYLFLIETLKKDSVSQRRTIKGDLKEIIPLFQGSLKYMQVTSAIYQFAAGLTSELLILYVTDPNYLGLTNTEWGTILSTMQLIGLLTSLPGGMMADKYNRVKLNVFARSIAPITNLAYIFLRGFWLILGTRMIAGVGMGLSGAAEVGMIGGTSWNALMADLVPPEKRGRFSGIMSTFNGAVSLPSPSVGAWLWDTPGVGPVGDFWVSIILGLVSTAIFGKFVKDPRFEKGKKIRMEAEEHDEKASSS